MKTPQKLAMIPQTPALQSSSAFPQLPVPDSQCFCSSPSISAAHWQSKLGRTDKANTQVMFLTVTGLAAWSKVNLRVKRLSGEEWLKMSLGKNPKYCCKPSLRPANMKKLISASWDILGTSELSYVGWLNHSNKWTVLIPTGNREIYFQQSHVNLGN